MRRRFTFALLPLALAAGCTNVEQYEDQIRELSFHRDAAEQAAEQAIINQRLAEKELELQAKKTRVQEEKLALAYDALREARTRLDTGLHDRLTQLSEATVNPGDRFQISQYGGIILESGIFFGSGRHELTSAGQQALAGIVTALQKDEYRTYDIEVSGHTDSDPITRSADRFRDNHDLASLRANSVRRFLIDKGVPGERIHLSSWGPHRPLGQDKAKDRRVEILLHKHSTEPSDGALPASAPREE